ncbi:MAG: TIGR02266 family protein [Deltaproteobacteria bacterium]|nr:TIGR02266 family protein [Deltaproteobacteria bacterium]
MKKTPGESTSFLGSIKEKLGRLFGGGSGAPARAEPRVQDTLALSYEDDQSFVQAFSGDINSGGLFIKTDKPRNVGEHFYLDLQLPQVPDPIKIKCEVTWAKRPSPGGDDRPAGMGVTFLEMNSADNQTLREYLKETMKEEFTVILQKNLPI